MHAHAITIKVFLEGRKVINGGSPMYLVRLVLSGCLCICKYSVGEYLPIESSRPSVCYSMLLIMRRGGCLKEDLHSNCVCVHKR